MSTARAICRMCLWRDRLTTCNHAHPDTYDGHKDVQRCAAAFDCGECSECQRILLGLPPSPPNITTLPPARVT